MEFGILGTLEVHDGGRPVNVGGRKVRMLLAALVVHAGRVVSKDRLIDVLWGPAAPDRTGHPAEPRRPSPNRAPAQPTSPRTRCADYT